ncbi:MULTISPECIES: DUF4345 family protein [Hyphobacterium]|uniref:DUF4345 family protein n=1 Tax=Hyphobacterium vulgare TaxID=1736751 RepID=A0ABV7A0U8_9PROT
MTIAATVIRIVIILISVGFVFIGAIGFMQPERLAEAVSLLPQAPEGLASVRALIGAHYLAMGLVGIYAAIRIHPGWLVPLAAIEAVMVIARITSIAAGELDTAGMVQTGMEVVAASLLALGAFLPIRPLKQNA